MGKTVAPESIHARVNHAQWIYFRCYRKWVSEHVNREVEMTTTTVQVGTVVRYHGSIASEHWSTFYVSAVEPSGRFELTDRDYPAVSVLRHVRRASFTPTGEHIDVCVCGHDAHNATQYGTCGAHPCECPLAHDNEEPVA